jgi:Fe2+ transport system protein FeoA
MKPISAMEPGETLLLERISEELELDDEMLGFLYSSGFHPKTEIELVGKDPQGAFTVSVDGKRVGVGSFAADRLFVAI